MTISVSSEPTASELILVLERLGWKQTGGVPDLLSAWSTADETSNVVVPLDPSRGDFASLLDRAYRTVISHHGVAVDRAIQAVLRSTREIFDASKFLRDTASEGGIIPWLTGKELFTAAEQSLAAAARSTRSPRHYHGNASSYLASNFLQSAYMGQTEVGSFVVTLLTQPNDAFAATKSAESKAGQALTSNAGLVTGRQVLTTLQSALAGTRTVLDEFKRVPKLDPFVELVSEGVSYELLRALATVSQDVRHSGIALEFAQSEGTARRSEFEFSAEESPVLERASRRLLADPDPIDATVIGDVTMLSRASAGSDGVIRIRVRSGADLQAVRVRVSDDEYRQVLDAHRDGLSLEVSGRLEREGNYYWMYSTSSLNILDNPDDYVGEDGSQSALFDDEDDDEDA